MKITFWSSTENRGFLARLIVELRAQGVEAQLRFTVSEASYRAAQSPLARVWLRLRQYLVYPLQLMAALAWERLARRTPDAWHVVTTNTFYAPWLASCLHPRIIHLVYDLFPEAAIAAGQWPADSGKARLCRQIVRRTLRQCPMNVFLGQRLEHYARGLYSGDWRSAVIPVGGDQAALAAPPTPDADAQSLEILYAGNLGQLHELETLRAYWQTSPPVDGVQWRFQCFGPAKAALQAACAQLPPAQQSGIQLGGGLAEAEWVSALRAAPLSLVLMKPGAENVVFPSKAFSAMLAGSALLVIAPEQSDLVDLVKAADAGWWLAPGDVAALHGLLDGLTQQPEQIAQKRQNAYRYAHAKLGQDSLAKEWVTLVDKAV